ncbi:MAG: anti-sigma factor family protein [Actinomycetales bacterium]
MTDHRGPHHPGEGGHLSPEQLDELTLATDPVQGLSTGASAIGPEQHLAGCPDCQTALADQLAVRRMLQRVPDPGPMPADVIARLDSALANAGTRNVAAPATVVPLRSPERRSGVLGRLAESRLTKSLVAAAAVGLIGIGGYSAINRQTGTAGGSSASRANDSSAGGGSVPKAVQQLSGVHPLASGSAYTQANIAGLLAKRLAAKPASGISDFAEQSSGGPLATTAGLQSCLQALGEPSTVPELVDLASFAGKPAAVLVLPTPSGGRVVWVVSRTCSPGHEGLLYYAALR